MIHPHFKELRRRIKRCLSNTDTPHPDQIKKYPWLYGALGDPESQVVFVCENPSRTGVEHVDKHLPKDLGIEKQWRGHRAMRFRRVLCRLKLKESAPDETGGWRCYITNVAKEMELVSETREKNASEKRDVVRRWAEVLDWELTRSRRNIVFCVGRKAEKALKLLRRERSLSYRGPCLYVPHYSMRRSDEEVESKMRDAVLDGLRQCDALLALEEIHSR